MSQQTIVRLKVVSADLDPDQVSAAIGMPCDRCWRIGDFRAQTIIKEKQNGWVLDSKLPRTAALDEHVSALLLVLGPRADAVRHLAAVATVEFSCVIYSDYNPGLNFDASAVGSIARLGASLDIDIYAFGSDVSS